MLLGSTISITKNSLQSDESNEVTRVGPYTIGLLVRIQRVSCFVTKSNQFEMPVYIQVATSEYMGLMRGQLLKLLRRMSNADLNA